MPGLHSPISKALFIHEGLVKTTGAAGNLAKGELAIVTDKAIVGGLKVVSDFAGLPKNAPLKFRVGRKKLPSNLRSPYAPTYETSWFTANDVVSIEANFPKFTERTFDEVLVGYDGINADTAITLEEGQTTILDVIISGDPVDVYTRGCEYTVKIHFGREVGETNQEAVQRAVNRLKQFKLPAGKALTDLVDVKIVDSTNPVLTGVPYVFSTLNVVDQGDSNALALVQAQYAYEVIRTDRNQTTFTSEYTVLHPQSVSLADFTHTVVDASVKGCADCLAGYSELTGGVVYSITLEDDGVTQVTTVDNLPGFVSGTAVRTGSSDGVGTYSVVVATELTSAQIATFVATNAITSTAEFTKIGSIADVCSKSTTTTVAWVDGQVCYATVEQYNIQLKDNECGETRLAELQSAYPSLAIEEGIATGRASQAITITGSSGDMSLVIAGTTYTTTYATSPTVTATAFVTAHATAILDATGATVTSSGAVITVTDDAEVFPSITAVAGGLTETIAPINYLTTATAGGCQRVYSTNVVTNIVCSECDDIFLQGFTSVAPESFEFSSWTLVAPTPNDDALMGILLKGKAFDVYPTDAVRDEIPFYETSTRISVAGGYIENQYENFQPIYSDIFNVVRLSRAQDRDALGYNFLPWEDLSRAHFLGEQRNVDNQFARANFGEESLLKFNAQYVTYEVTFDDTKYSQGAGGRSSIGHSQMIVVEFGYHTALETALNALASKAGVEIVNPTAN